MASAAAQFEEPRDASIDKEVLSRTVGDLQLALRGTRLEAHVDRLYAELAAVGLVFRPPVYLSDEWGCPDQVPIIGVPFYLADESLTRLHDRMMEGVEAESDRDIMRYLRHEAGHAFNYAYRLFELSEWTDLFGPFVRPYPDEYHPHPYSKSFVRHLPAWYAQKHPDEDFAETFAVWLDPASNWRKVYAGWGCLKKLEYVERVARDIGGRPPAVTADDYDTNEDFLRATIGDLYQRWATPLAELPRMFDSALEDIFPPARVDAVAEAAASGPGPERAADASFNGRGDARFDGKASLSDAKNEATTDASINAKPDARATGKSETRSDARADAKRPPADKFLAKHRRAIVAAVFHWTGLDDAVVRTLITHLQQRCVALDLRVPDNADAALIQITAFITMLSTNRVQTGEFVRS